MLRRRVFMVAAVVLLAAAISIAVLAATSRGPHVAPSRSELHRKVVRALQRATVDETSVKVLAALSGVDPSSDKAYAAQLDAARAITALQPYEPPIAYDRDLLTIADQASSKDGEYLIVIREKQSSKLVLSVRLKRIRTGHWPFESHTWVVVSSRSVCGGEVKCLRDDVEMSSHERECLRQQRLQEKHPGMQFQSGCPGIGTRQSSH